MKSEARALKKTAVIYTGGTIGSKVKDGVTDIAGVAFGDLLKGELDVEEFYPFSALSENFGLFHYRKLADCILSLPSDIKAVIIAHGTDTLSFTAAFLSFAFPNFGKPVMLVSADYPLNSGKGNGRDNIHAAAAFINQVGAAGVFVPYKNPGDGFTNIHFGCRTFEAEDFSGAYRSPFGKTCARFSDGKITDLAVRTGGSGRALLRLSPEAKVAVIKPYPLMDYSCLDVTSCKAVLHLSYHSGTADAKKLKAFAKSCGVPVYIVGGRPDITYGSRAEFADSVKLVDLIAPVALYMKLRLAYTNFAGKDAEKYVYENICGEFFDLPG